MGFTLQSLILFLRNLVSLFRKRWGQSIRRLWSILLSWRSRFLSQHPERDKIRRTIASQPAEPNQTTVIHASQLPPLGANIPGTYATPVSIEPEPSPFQTDPEATLHDHHDITDDLEVGRFFLGESRPISRSPDLASNYEPDPIDVILPPTYHESASSSRVTRSRPISSPTSRHSYRPASQHAGDRPRNRSSSQFSRRPPSVYSFRSPPDLSGAETAARGYLPAAPSLWESLPQLSIRSPSIAGSVASRVHRASRSTTSLRRPYPASNAPKRGASSSTPAFGRKDVHKDSEDPEAWTTRPVYHDREATHPSRSLLPGRRLRPMVMINRYEKHRQVIVEEGVFGQVFPPVTIQFVRESAPKNWIPLLHPEGALYWVHERDPIYTDTNMADPVLRQEIERALGELNELKESCPPLPIDDWELALELETDGETGEPICLYYFVCHSTRCLFWLHEFDPESALSGLRGVTELTHVHLALQAQYWSHWEMYPHNREVPEYLAQELSGILVHAGVDCMTSPGSTVPYSEGEIGKLLGYVKHITLIGGNYGFSACVVGRLMGFFTSSRFLNFYGQRGARLTNDQTIYVSQQKRTLLIKASCVFLFYVPDLYLRGLNSVYTDSIFYQHRWAEFITWLMADWTGSILYCVVLLVANVVFLAVPSVDPGNRTRTAAQLASYLSVITSIGSIVIGLFLLRWHGNKPQDSSEQVGSYLRSHRRIETLAILYSLPYSFLLWSTLVFITAFGIETIAFSHQLWIKLSVGIPLMVMVLLISWYIWNLVEIQIYFGIPSRVHLWKDHLVDVAKSLRGNIPSGTDARDGGQRVLRRANLTRISIQRRLFARRQHVGEGVEMNEYRNEVPTSEVEDVRV